MSPSIVNGQETSVVDDRRILQTVKKNMFLNRLKRIENTPGCGRRSVRRPSREDYASIISEGSPQDTNPRMVRLQLAMSMGRRHQAVIDCKGFAMEMLNMMNLFQCALICPITFGTLKLGGCV